MREDLDQQPADRILKRILDKSGYAKMLENDLSPEAEGRRGNLEELVSAAADAAQRGESLEEFLDHAALVSDSDDVDEKAQISLLTMHNAKGLEFPVVFIAGMEEGLFPHSRSRDNEEQLEEERRLCYVAMTRAEKRLYLSHAKSRRKYGGSPLEPCTPSRFLDEVPKELIEDLTEDRTSAFQVDLYGERQMVREVARRNTYTGKTYNSLDHISQFFAERGIFDSGGAAVRTGFGHTAGSDASQEAGSRCSHQAARETGGATGSRSGGNASSASSGPDTRRPAGQPSSQGVMFPVHPPEPLMYPSDASRLRESLSGAGGPGNSVSNFAATPRFVAPKAPAASRPVAAPKRGGVVRAGATVAHPKYGKGLVLRKEGDGDEAKITVSFPGHGLKKLVAKYASLKVLD